MPSLPCSLAGRGGCCGGTGPRTRVGRDRADARAGRTGHGACCNNSFICARSTSSGTLTCILIPPDNRSGMHDRSQEHW